MPPFQTEEKTKLRRKLTEHAIALAMESRWEEAIQANRELIELFADEVDAHNRLGKALTELGRYAEAKEAYTRALELDRNNTIARRNLSRLSHLEQTQPTPATVPDRVEPFIFIEETGKTGTYFLHHPAPSPVLARMSAGDLVQLRAKGKTLEVTNLRGDYLGQMEPKLGLRLLKLIEGGNRYAAAIASLSETGAKIIIRETYQHPSQAGRMSFPSRTLERFRPYIKESLLHYELEEEAEEGNEGAGWDEGGVDFARGAVLEGDDDEDGDEDIDEEIEDE